jgi:hypothetical protein
MRRPHLDPRYPGLHLPKLPSSLAAPAYPNPNRNAHLAAAGVA